MRSFRLRQPPEPPPSGNSATKAPTLFSLRRLVGKPFPASLPSSVRRRLLAPLPWRWRSRWRCSAVCCGRWRCAAASPPPCGPLVCVVAVLRPRPTSPAHRRKPAPWQHRQRVSVTLPQKGKRPKGSVQSRCRCCRVLCPRFRVLASRNLPVLPLAPGRASCQVPTTPPPKLPKRKRHQGSASEGATARHGRPEPQGGRSQPRRPTTGHRPVPVLPRSAKTSFPGRGPLRCAPWSFSRLRQKEPNHCRAGRTGLPVAAAGLPPARWWADPPKAQTPRGGVTGRG